MRIPLVGESYTLRNPAAAAQQTLNLMPQWIDDPEEKGKNKGILQGCPGYHSMINLGSSPIRGLWSGGGRLFVAYDGGTLVEIGQGTYVGGNPSTGTATVLSTTSIGTFDSNPVQI